MSDNEKKFYELSEKEQKDKLTSLKKKTKVITKKILLGAFCIIVILLMVFGLLAGAIFKDENSESDSHNHAHAIVELI